MNIANIQIGYGTEIEDMISLNIYFSGCMNNKKCNRKKCHNQELLDFNYGKLATSYIYNIKKILSNNNIIDCLCLLGGEPLDQNLNDLFDFLIQIKNNKPIYTYTGYTQDQLYDLKKEYLTKIKFTNICYGEFKKGENNKKWLYNF